MKTDDLISMLARNEPAPDRAGLTRTLIALVAGGVLLSFLLVYFLLQLNPALGTVVSHAPAMNALANNRAPHIETRMDTSGRPNALLTGANRICSVIIGMARPSTCISGTISSHLGPNSTSTSGPALAAMPMNTPSGRR